MTDSHEPDPEWDVNQILDEDDDTNAVPTSVVTERALSPRGRRGRDGGGGGGRKSVSADQVREDEGKVVRLIEKGVLSRERLDEMRQGALVTAPTRSALEEIATVLAGEWAELPAERKEAVYRRHLLKEKMALEGKVVELTRQRDEALFALEKIRRNGGFDGDSQTTSAEMAALQSRYEQALEERDMLARRLENRRTREEDESQDAYLRSFEIQVARYQAQVSRLQTELAIARNEEPPLKSDIGDLGTAAENKSSTSNVFSSSALFAGGAGGDGNSLDDVQQYVRDTRHALMVFVSDLAKATDASKKTKVQMNSTLRTLRDASENFGKMDRRLQRRVTALEEVSTDADHDAEGGLHDRLQAVNDQLEASRGKLDSSASAWEQQEAKLSSSSTYLQQCIKVVGEMITALVEKLDAVEERSVVLAQMMDAGGAEELKRRREAGKGALRSKGTNTVLCLIAEHTVSKGTKKKTKKGGAGKKKKLSASKSGTLRSRSRSRGTSSKGKGTGARKRRNSFDGGKPATSRAGWNSSTMV